MSSKPFIFIQDSGTYTNETIVAINANPSDIIKKAKGYGMKKDAIEWLEKITKEPKPSESGFVIMEPSKGWSLLWLKEYKNDWNYWELLLHEVSHLVDFILVEQKKMGEETEARAYQMEYLFRSIRRKLMDHYEKRRGKSSKKKRR